MRGKLIIIEGTDCSGKGTQTKRLIENLEERLVRVKYLSFPNYNTPTGKIVGGPYLGKTFITNGWFPEGAPNVDPKVSSLYYAADRRYSKELLDDSLKKGYTVVLDRYTTSNMAHQGGKIRDKEERKKMYQWLETLEYEMLELPRPDIKIFLHVPFEYSLELKKGRKEALDELESDENHLRCAEEAYLEMAELYDFYKIDCIQNGKMRSIDDISEEIFKYIEKLLPRKDDGSPSIWI